MPRRAVREELAIEYVPLDEVQKWPGNPKNHDIGAICASIEAFGFRDPLGVNRRTREIEEGHGRIDTLRAMCAQGRRPPAFIKLGEDGEWLVPVLYFEDDSRTQRAYSLASNRTQELGGGYDDDRLLAALQEQAGGPLLDAAGYDEDDIEALRRKLNDEDAPRTDSLNVLVTCQSQDQRSDLMERLAAEGFTCREV